MDTTRRSLLGAGVVGGALAGLVGCTEDDPPASAPSASALADTDQPPLDHLDWASVQAQFPLDPTMVQLAAFVLSPHPRPVQRAIDGYREELGIDTEAALLSGIERDDGVRAALAEFAGGIPEQFALTDSTTMGLGLMYGGLGLTADDEVVTSTHDFYSTVDSLRLLRQRTGCSVQEVTLYDAPEDADLDEMVGRVAAAITPRTKVVALTWVHSSTGVRVPVAEICAALEGLSKVPRDQYVVCIDGVHGFAATDLDLPDLGCDFVATGTHKWMFGPRGTGLLWGRDWAPLTEIIPSFSAPEPPSGRLTPGGYQAFEHRWAVADAAAMMSAIGRARVVERTTSLATRLKEGLAGIPGVQLRTPMDPAVSAGIVCFEVDGLGAPEAVYAMKEAGVVGSATPYATSYARLGPSIASSQDDVEEAIDAVSGLV